MGTYQGALGHSGVALATANRKFPGREGSMESRVYLGIPAIVASKALYGEIADPREIDTTRYDDHAISNVGVV